MGKPPSQRQQIAAILAGVAVLVGGGGGAGYALHGTTAKASEGQSTDRIAALEQWRAARTALEDRDREDRLALTRALETQNATNVSLRDAVIALTERMGAMDARLRAVESTRSASFRR
jgi:hypothetical protein